MTTTTHVRDRAKRDFTETQWYLVKAAGDQSNPAAAAALEMLCERYWPPIYVYVRRQGRSKQDAEDLTQGFFRQIIEKNSFAEANETKGKFRSYLLGALNHFLADDWDRSRAKKRGSGETILSLEEAEEKYTEVPSPDLTPEKAFDYRWRLTLLEEGLKRLQNKCKADGKERLFELLKPYLEKELNRADCERVARELKVSLNATAVMVHRFRGQFGKFVRVELADTVTNDEELAEEMQELFGAGPAQG